MRVRLLCMISTLLFVQTIATAQSQKLEVVKIADGIYGAIFSEPRMDPVESNSIILINDNYVLVVDANRTPASARTIIKEIRKLTDKPVRYVVNSHWHDDHVFGNQSYQEAFPQVEFIAHGNTRDDMEHLAFPHIQRGIDRWTKEVSETAAKLSKGVKPNGEKLSEQEM